MPCTVDLHSGLIARDAPSEEELAKIEVPGREYVEFNGQEFEVVERDGDFVADVDAFTAVAQEANKFSN